MRKRSFPQEAPTFIGGSSSPQAVISALAKLVFERYSHEVSLEEIAQELKKDSYAYLTYDELLPASKLDRNTFRERFRKASELLQDKTIPITRDNKKVYKMTKETIEKFLDIVTQEEERNNDWKIEF